MLEELTPEQEKMIDVYYEKYLKIGLDSTPVDIEKCRKQINIIYKCMKLEKPDIVLFNDPVSAIKEIKKQKKDFSTISDLEGNHSAAWVGFRDYFFTECKIDFAEDNEIFVAYRELIKNAGWLYLFEKVAIVCEKPVVKYSDINNNFMLHSADGPAIYFRNTKPTDECNIWILNNVVVNSKIVTTPANEIPMKWYFEEKNIEIRREIYRKIGAERFLKESKAELIDIWIPDNDEIELMVASNEKNKYELYLLDLGFKKVKYLKMQLTDKYGFTSFYLECPVNQNTNSAKEAYYSDRKWTKNKKTILS